MHTYTYNSTSGVTGSVHTVVHWNSVIDVYKMSIGQSATSDAAGNIIGKIDMAIDYIANARASMGAQQKRIENTRDGLMTYQDNLAAAESKIRDVDMASESTEFAKDQITCQRRHSHAVSGQPVAVLRARSCSKDNASRGIDAPQKSRRHEPVAPFFSKSDYVVCM